MVGQRPIELQELSKYFNMPEKAVAKTLGICLTSLKKLARQNGITRWPYRKIKSLDKKLRKLEVAMSTAKDDPSMVYAKWGDSNSETASSHSSSSPTPGSEDASMASTPRAAHDGSPSPSSRLSPVSRPAGVEQQQQQQQPAAASQATAYCSPVPVRVQNVVTPCKTGEPIKLELSLSPSMLQSVACGTNNITFVMSGGDMRCNEAHGTCNGTFASSLMNKAPQANDAAPVPAIKIEPGCAPTTAVAASAKELSDEEIIAMLAQCAGSETRSRTVTQAPDTTSSLQEAAQALSDVEIMQALAGCCEVPHAYSYEQDHEAQLPRYLTMGPASNSADSRPFMELDGADDDFHAFHSVFPCDGHNDHFVDMSA